MISPEISRTIESEALRKPNIELGLYIPEEIITNDEVERWGLRHSDGKPLTADSLVGKIGVERRFLALDEDSYQMGIKSAESLVQGKPSPDIVLFSSSYPIGTNQAEDLSQNFELNPRGHLEIGAACSGFTVGLAELKKQQGQLEGADVLFVASEKYSDKCLDLRENPLEDDPSLAQLLFSDGAVAMRFRLGEDLKILHTESFEKITDDIMMPIDESRRAGSYLGLYVPKSPDYFRQKGTNVLKIVSREVPPLIDLAVEGAGLKSEDIKMIIPHQPSQQTLRSLSKRAPEYTFVADFQDGNFSSASIPKALNKVLSGQQFDYVRDNRFGEEKLTIEKGDKVVLVGFGAGMHANIAVVEF